VAHHEDDHRRGEREARVAVLSILPTFAMWERLSDPEYAMRAFRWYFLAQPPALPQQLIETNAHRYVRATLAGWTAGSDLSSFLPEALDAYEAANVKSSVIAAGCADYRAGWTTDRLHDDADLAAGHKIGCPVLALWGSHEFPDSASMLAAWRRIASRVDGQAFDCGHFLPEEAPDAVARSLLRFFAD
jgi:haloacetate dehalogenase